MHGEVRDLRSVAQKLADACTQMQVEDEAVEERVPEECADLHGQYCSCVFLKSTAAVS